MIQQPFHAQAVRRGKGDRNPWTLELYRLRAGQLALVGRSTEAQPTVVPGEVLALSFRLMPGEPRPRIDVRHSDGRAWAI